MFPNLEKRNAESLTHQRRFVAAVGRQWIKARKHDPYYRRAKAMAYRSRAAFKLLQIQSRFHLVQRGDAVVDLGAAPGGWSQIAADLVGREGRVAAVDLVAMSPIEGVEVLRGDLRDASTQAIVLERLGRPADVVVCDAAPKLSGVRSLDQARAIELARVALDLAGRALRPGGSFVAKAFRGSDYNGLLADVAARFASVKEYTPPASPKGSAEVFIVGLGRL